MPCTGLCVMQFLFFLGKYLSVKLLSHMVRMFVYKKLPLVSKWPYLQQCMRDPVAYTFLSILDIIVLSNFSYRSAWYFTVIKFAFS